MKPALKTILAVSALLTACGDDGGSGATNPPSPTSLSIGPVTDTTETGINLTEDSGGESNSESDSEGTDTTGPTSTSFPDTPTTTSDFEPPKCDPVLRATIRDFRVNHPDFQAFSGNAAHKGIVEDELGPDNKPVYAHPGATPQTTGPDEFAQWYNDVPDVNMAFEIDIPLIEVSPGQFTYENTSFFPIDDQGWGNEGNPHNYHFTTEIHTVFTYQGGEVFTFIGDDDLWLFINGKLAIDLGGLHPQLTDSVDLDEVAAELGIKKGGTYSMDIFHAERRTSESNFRIDTSIQCFVIPG